MCCYETIVNTVIQKIIAAMHTTTDVPQYRKMAREALLDAEINKEKKTLTFYVRSQADLATLAQTIGPPFAMACAMACPGYRTTFKIKQPLDLAAFAQRAKMTP